MLAARRVSDVGRLEPKIVTESGMEATGVDAPEPVRDVLASVNHLGYGAAAGGLFALVSPMVPADPVLTGPVYGLVVGVASYEGWVPAAGILPPLRHMSPPRRLQLLLAHAAYGAVLGALLRRRSGATAPGYSVRSPA